MSSRLEVTAVCSSWTYVTPGSPCRACGRGDYCKASSDGAFLCRRGPFDGSYEKQDRNGAPFWIGFPGGVTPTAPTFEPDTGPQPAPPEQLDRVYRELLSHLSLSPAHRQQLLARGFTAEEVDRLGFRSLDQAARQVAKRIAELFPLVWQAVPGLHLKNSRPALGGWSGLLIPCQDLQGRVIALRIRPDSPDAPKYSWLSSERHGGPGPGAPLSYWAGAAGAPTDAVRVTEGELKAALAALRTGIPTIACPGVGLFGGDQVLDWLLELGATRVILSPDSDYRIKRQVHRPVCNAITRLGAVPYPITLETWEPTVKGVDDALQAGLAIQEVQPEEFYSMIKPEHPATAQGFAVVGEAGEDQWATNPVTYPAAPDEADRDDWAEQDPEPLDDMPAAIPFPVDVLPDPIRRFVIARAEELQTPVDMQAVTLLGAASVPLLRSIELNPYGSWVEPIGILAAPVAVPSELKSATHRAIFAPHESEQARQVALTNTENARRRAAKRVLSMEISQAKKDGDHQKLSSLMDQVEELEPKVLPCILIDDATDEAKAMVMSQNQGRVGVSSPEGSLFANVAKYSNDGSVAVDTVIKAHAGDPIRVHRVGRQPIDIPKTGMGGTIMPQPEVLEALGKHRCLKGIGFLARWVWSVPKSKVGERNMYPEICSRALYFEWDRICSRMFTLGADPDSPQVFTFTPQAVTRLREFRGEIEPLLAGDLAYMSDWAGKLAGLSVRFAGILHILEHFSSGASSELPSAVKLDTLERAICLGRYALDHAKRAYYLMGFRPDQQGPRDIFAVLDKLLSLARKGERVSVRELHRSLDKQLRFKRRENLDGVLRELEAKGWLKLAKDATGGRPTDFVILHPKSFELYREGDKRDKSQNWSSNAVTTPFVLSPHGKNKGGQKGSKGGQKPPDALEATADAYGLGGEELF